MPARTCIATAHRLVNIKHHVVKHAKKQRSHLYAPASLRRGEDDVHGILSRIIQFDLERKAGIHLQHGLQQIHDPCS